MGLNTRIFERRPNDPVLAGELLDMIARLRSSAQGATIDKYLSQDLLSTPSSSNYVSGRDDTPAYFWAVFDQLILIVIDGATRLRQGQLLVQAYGAPLPLGVIVNSYLSAAATSITGEITNGRSPGPRRIVVAGHSLGGAIAVAILHYYAVHHPLTRRTCVTFGSPRTGTDALGRLLMTEDICRFMNSDDPVPLVPPRGDQAPLVTIALPAENISRWSYYTHVRGGMEIKPNGTMTPSDLPTAAVVSPQLSLGTWLAWLYTDINSAHSIGNYQLRIKAWLNSHTASELPDPPESRPEDASHTRVDAVRRIQADTRTAIQLAARGNRGVRTVVPSTERFVARNNHGLWQVEWQGVVIVSCRGERQARAVARTGNGFLVAMQSSDTIDAQAIVDAMVNYMSQALDDDSGFAPVPNQPIG